MLKKQLLFVTTLLLSLTSYSQNLFGVIYYDKPKVTPFYSEGSKAKVKLYMENDWLDGSMILKDSTFISPASFKYDALNDRIEIKMIVDPNSVDRIVFGGHFFIYSLFYFNGEERSGYFEILSDGKAKLLKRRYVNLFPAKEGALGHESFNAIGFSTFIKVGDLPAIPLKSSKKEIIEQFRDKKDEVSQFISENKLNVKNKKDLRKLMKYYNSL